MPITLLYDFVWLWEKTGEYWDNTSEAGFAQEILLFIYIITFYKIILSMLLWKASVNFEAFVK